MIIGVYWVSGMPKRIASWQSFRRTPRAENRPNSSARGYGSAAWRRTRLAVIARDQGVCQLCGCVVTERGQIDHIQEKAQGGSDEMVNLRLLCLPCHSRRHAGER